MTKVTIRVMETGDWPAVERIYAEGIATGNATFEAQPPSWDNFNRSKREDLRFVATEGSEVIGWIAAAPVSARPSYAGVVEHSVYVSSLVHGEGIGNQLLGRLVVESESVGVWMIQSSIFRENTASLALHRRHGFREVGTRERIALMTHGPWAGNWRDTVLIERRLVSPPPDKYV